MKIIYPDEIMKQSKEVFGGRLFLARDGQEIGMTTEKHNGLVTDIEVPESMDFLDVEIYILPMVYRQRNNGRFTENKLPARGQKNWIAIGPKEDWINYDYLIWHELGHVFHNQILNFDMVSMSKEFKEYMNLRNISNWGYGSSEHHHKRAEEIFADDFAYLFGGVGIEDAIYLQPQYGAGLPNDEIKEYILSFFPKGGRINEINDRCRSWRA